MYRWYILIIMHFKYPTGFEPVTFNLEVVALSN